MSKEERDIEDLVLWQLAWPSQEFEEGPVIRISGDVVTLSYDYETPTGNYEWEHAMFSSVLAVSFTGDESCTEDQVAAYDKLLAVPDSDWVASLQAARQAARSEPAPEVRHMRIYFDEIGCLEVVAARFEPPRAGAVTDGGEAR